jgi:two-component system NarL family sensor kinase
MRRKHLGYLIIISLFLLFSCQENNKNGDLTLKSTSLDSKFIHLPEYKWISDFQNYFDETYSTRFHQRFDQSIQAHKWEDAAGYLIAYGISAKQTQSLDSIFVSKATDFYTNNSDKISNEAKSTLAHYLGAQYKNVLQFEKAKEWFGKSFSIEPETTIIKQSIGLSHLLLGQIYFEQRDLVNAEEQILTSLKIFDEIGDKENQGKGYLLMHALHVRNLAYEKAENYLDQAIDIFEKEKSEFYALTAHIFYVQYHMEKNDSLKAIGQIDKMAKYAKSYEGITDYHKGFLNQFLVFKHISQENEDSATYYLNQSKEIVDKTGIPDLKMRHFFIGISYAMKFHKPIENPEEVEMFYEELSKLESPNLQKRYQLAYALYDYYRGKGDYKKSNEYGGFLIRDAHLQAAEKVKSQLFELETRYETEKKEKTILKQEQKIEQKNKTIIYLILASILIVLVFLLLIIWTKNKVILKEKLLTQNFTAQLLEKTENERKRIASDLHDSVSNELVNLRHVIENSDSNLKMKIDSILEEVRNISRNISPTMFDKVGLKLSVEQLTERIQQQHDFFLSSEITYKGGLSSAKELQLYRIIQEAITNTLKHADAVAGKITIEETDKNIMLEIKDNGKGFDVDKMMEKGNSFGLLNIRERVKYLNGTVDFKSDSSGTIINIVVPK